jgi:hypothetical protein
LFRRGLPFVALAVFSLSVAEARAQRLEDGERELTKKSKPLRSLINQLLKGEVIANPNDTDHKDAAQYAAKEIVYPLHWESSVTPPPGKMENQVTAFFSRLNQLSNPRVRVITGNFARMYSRNVIDCAQEVIQRGKPLAAINAARMLSRIPERPVVRGAPQSEKDWTEEVLPRLAEGNAEHYATVLIGILEGKKTNDAVKYWVLRGLKDLLALPAQTPALLKPDTHDKAIKAAMNLVEKKVHFTKAAPRGEVMGYCVLRREAVKVVAQARVAVLAGGQDRPALTLLRVVARDASIVPPPRLDERMEATIGLASVRTKDKDYQPDYAAEYIARFVLDFCTAADENSEARKLERQHPWKIHAARLIEALEPFKAEVKDGYVSKAVDACLPPLRDVEKGGKTSKENLANWPDNNKPAAQTLFRGVPESAVKMGAVEKPEKKEPEKKPEKKEPEKKKPDKKKPDKKKP